MADAMQLAHSSGWETLMAILESYSGERSLKRSWLSTTEDTPGDAGSPSEQLAKRMKQADIRA